MHNGWPAICGQEPRITHKYWGHERWADIRQWLTPQRLQNHHSNSPPESFLHDLHEKQAHIAKWQLMARSLIHWLGINRDIKGYLMWCPTCIKLLTTLSAEPLINHDVPKGLWQKSRQISWTGTTKGTYPSWIMYQNNPSYSKCLLPLWLLSLTVWQSHMSSNEFPWKSSGTMDNSPTSRNGTSQPLEFLCLMKL